MLYALSRKIIILLNVFSRYNFQKAVNQPSGDRHSRGMSCWDQFVIVLFCHLAKAKSLREIIGGMAFQASSFYHLGAKLMKRSSLSYANAHCPWKIYRGVFYQFLTQCCFFKQDIRFVLKTNC